MPNHNLPSAVSVVEMRAVKYDLLLSFPIDYEIWTGGPVVCLFIYHLLLKAA